MGIKMTEFISHFYQLSSVVLLTLGVSQTPENISIFLALVSIVATLLVGPLYGFVSWFLKLIWAFFTKKELMKGYWTGVAYDNDGEIRKIDQYYARERKGELYLTGKRVFPEDQKGWRWRFYGVRRNHEVFGYFTSKDPSVNSRGCIVLRSEKVSDVFKGYYVTFVDKELKDGFSKTNSIRQIRYEWRRGKPTKHFTPEQLNTTKKITIGRALKLIPYFNKENETKEG